MDIRVTDRTAAGRTGDNQLAEHARWRLQSRLRDRADHVEHVSVSFGVSGSRRSRLDSYCVMQVQVRGAPAATVMGIGAHALETIARTADRVGRLVEGQLRLAHGKRLPAT